MVGWSTGRAAEVDEALSVTVSRWARGRIEPDEVRAPLRWGLVVALVLMLVTAAGVPVYVHPRTDELRRADAIFVLGGPGYDRYVLGFELAEQGWAPTLVVSNPNGSRDPWLASKCVQSHPNFNVQCFFPDPPTTQGEAQELGRLAAKYNWHTVIVVTLRSHVSRARQIVERCYDGDLVVVASRTHLNAFKWVWQYAYQTAGYARAAFQSGC